MGKEEPQRVPGSTARSTKDDDPEKSEGSQKKEKEFAWMDSGDEDDTVNENAASSEESEPVPAEKAPVSAVDVKTLSQMMSFMEQFPRATLLRLPMAECAAVCEASARVRYYDGEVFSDLLAGIRVHLRSRTPH